MGRGAENNAFTGAFIRKYIDPTITAAQATVNKSSQHWIVFRLGEIYLNTAEAAYELGKRVEAIDYIEKIRERAGCQVTRPELDQATSSTNGYPIEKVYNLSVMNVPVNFMLRLITGGISVFGELPTRC
jgi:hypothetical protein